jgi:hypothetical protein
MKMVRLTWHLGETWGRWKNSPTTSGLGSYVIAWYFTQSENAINYQLMLRTVLQKLVQSLSFFDTREI